MVERARTKCVGEAAFEADGTRILEAERDMLGTATATRSDDGEAQGSSQKKTGAESDRTRAQHVYKLVLRVIPTSILAPHIIT